MVEKFQTFSVLIIGAGNIGSMFDSPGDKEILTHAHAFSSHPGFKLMGFVDSNFNRAQQASQLWGGVPCKTISEAFENLKIDIVVVAVPDRYHFDLLRELVNYSFKVAVAEKPLAISTSQTKQIVDLYADKNISLAVNYSRRFVPEFAYLKAQIFANSFGRYLTGTGYYGKGILHNGTHLIDLIRFLLGDVSLVSTQNSIPDWSGEDSSFSAVLSTNGGLFFAQAVDARCFTMFELDLVFERKRIRILDSGFYVEEWDVCESVRFPGHKMLERSRLVPTSLTQALYGLADNIFDHLTRGNSLACTGGDGLTAVRIANEIIASY